MDSVKFGRPYLDTRSGWSAAELSRKVWAGCDWLPGCKQLWRRWWERWKWEAYRSKIYT